MKCKIMFYALLLLGFQLVAEVYVSGTIAESQTWTLENSPYIITGNLTIQGVANPVITIEPGVVVKLDASVSITVGNASNGSYTGGLICEGTTESRITFTANSESPTPGFWDGISFSRYADNENLSFSYTDFLYGGDGGGNANVYILLAAPTFSHCSFQFSSGHGLNLYNFSADDAKPTISNCIFSDNESYPIHLNANEINCLQTGNTFTNNGIQKIFIDSGSITENVTIRNFSIPYFISSNLTVSSTSFPECTISYDTILEFDSGGRITMGNASNGSYRGSLFANGVTFRGDENSAGYWDGIYLNTYTEAFVLNGCTIQDAGATVPYCAVNANATGENSLPSITGTTIENSSGYGVYINTDRRIELAGNDISNCANYPVSVHVNDVGSLGMNNNFSGNAIDMLEVRSGTVSESAVWENHGVPYHITGNITLYHTSFPHLEIKEGSVLKLNSGSNITIGNASNGSYQGSLHAKQVTFTHFNEEEYWGSIIFNRYAIDEFCKLEDCIFEYGGNNSSDAGIYLSNSAPFIDSCTFRDMLEFGIKITNLPDDNDVPTISNCFFHDNGSYPISLYSSDLDALEPGNIYENNNPNRILVQGDSIRRILTVINQEIPLEVHGNITLSYPTDPYLTLESGNVLYFDEANYITIAAISSSNYTGGLIANGVTFSSIPESETTWGGIRFNRYILPEYSRVENCIIENTDSYNIYIYQASPDIINSVIQNSSGNGIHITGSLAAPQIFGCTIQSNNIGIYAQSSANPLIGGASGNSNSIQGNTLYGVQNTSSTILIDATYNWWGDETGPFHATNSEGLGNAVSDYVDFSNFLTQPLSEAPSIFHLLSPAREDTVWTFNQLLNWETSIDPTPADTVKYELMLSTSSYFESAQTFSDILTSQFMTNDTILADDTRYYWKVQAYDTHGLTTNCIEQNWYFDVFVVEPPDDFELISPVHYETVMETSVLLEWEETTDPDPGDSVEYTVYLDETAAFSSPEIVTLSDTSVYTPFCTPGSIYYWYVKATDSFGYSTTTTVRRFYVSPDAAPRKPIDIVLIPQNGNEMYLSWEAVPGADQYHVYGSEDRNSIEDFLGTTIQTNFTHFLIGTEIMYFYQIVAEDTDVYRYWRDKNGNPIRK